MARRLINNDELLDEIGCYSMHTYNYGEYDYISYVLTQIFIESSMIFVEKKSSYVGYYSRVICIELNRKKYISKILDILNKYFPKDISNIIIKYAIQPVYLIYASNDVIKINRIYQPILRNHNKQLKKDMFLKSLDFNGKTKELSNAYLINKLDIMIITDINDIYKDADRYIEIKDAKTSSMKQVKKWLKEKQRNYNNG